MSILRRTITSKVVTWASRSFLGNLVLFEILLGIPSFIMFSYMDYTRGILRPARVIFVGITCLMEALVLAVMIWFALTRPALKSRAAALALRRAHVDKEASTDSGERMETHPHSGK